MGSSKSDNICNSSKYILTNTCCPSESTAAQESSIFGDISNLSPVQPLKDAAILQGFPGIASPPNVLTSPHINPQSSFLNRQQQCHTSSSEYSQGNVDLEKTTRILDDPGSSNPQSSIAVESSDRNGSNAIAFTQLQPVNALIAVDKLLVAPVDEEFIDSGRREHLDAAPKTLGSVMEKKDSMKDNCLASENSTMLLKQADECSIGGFVSDVNQMKNENYQFVATSEVCSDVISKPFIDHAHAQQECGESLHEVNHIQSGVLRRCLQFGECQQKSIRESSHDTTERQMSISDVSQNYSPETPYNRHVADQFEFASPMCLPSCTSAVVSKPRGIGLHLNSIVAGQRVDVVTGKQSSKGMVKLGGKSLILSGGITHVISSDNVEKISSISEADLHLTESVEVTTPNKLLLPDTAKPLDLPILLNPAGEELAESSGESNQAGSNTRKKQASNSANPDGCKRCSCKKSKCLKLYCDCFAAGLYCADSCSCKGCFNRPEQKESVIEARQLIESRNPLAFAPRIMQHVANSPTNSGESGEPVAPPSLRHKRGCNCRKSMCLKKYCECYEANVGCSDGCRCEGCKNVYGKKPDYSVSRHITNKRTFDEISEETPDQKRKLLITSRRHLSKEKGSDSPVAVPVTPTLPCSDSRKNEMKSLLPGRRYVLSPDPNLHTPPSAIHQSSSRSSLVEATQLTPSIHGGLVNLCHFTRLTNPLQTTTPMVAPSSNATTNAIQEAPPKPPFCEILKSESPEYLLSNVYLGDDTTDSDTPLILRDSSAPVKSVKVSSPNKKRVSPPHNHLNELRPSSSGELRSSRKFIFRSVPKFPPLSPCLDPNNLSDPPADTH